jgi:hypothetical protein
MGRASRRRAIPAAGFLLAVLGGLSLVTPTWLAADSLPARLSDREFWALVTDFSEPNGFFRSDNLLSNETGYQQVIPELLQTSAPGRVYMGVGPEQNFTYIAATRPAMVFIVDIRRGNLDLQLMYKALFELSADRADFVSRLFSKKRPSGLTTESTAAEILEAVRNADTSEDLYKENLKVIEDQLAVTHGFDLAPDDLRGVEYVYHSFYWFGPRIQYSSAGNFGGSFQPTYAELMAANDGHGVSRGFLASEENFQFMKALEARNLLVPVVGNFGGSKTIRAVGRYLKQRGATVSAFYLSNVEQYLQLDGLLGDFCENVASLPLDQTSTFIRSVRHPHDTVTLGLSSEIAAMLPEVQNCR